MVMHSNVIVCWRDPRQGCRDEKRIQLSWYAGVISGSHIASCPMHSNAVVCWRGSVTGIVCRQAYESDRVPGDLRRRDSRMPAHRSIEPAAQPALAVDAASRRARSLPFESSIRFDSYPDLQMRRN